MPDVTFKSDQFDALTPVEDAINDMLGHDLVMWIREHLIGRGFEVDDVINEDYGYGFWLQRDKSYYWVWATRYYPTYDEEDAVWLLGVHYDPGCLWGRWLRHRPSPLTLETIVNTVHDILMKTNHVSQIQWWKDDVGRGEPSNEPIL